MIFNLIHNLNRKALKALTVAAATVSLFSFSSCINEHFDEVEAPQPEAPQNYYLTLNLSLPNKAKDTRSSTTPEGESSSRYLDAADNESLLEDATVYFYDLSSNTVLLKLDSKPTISTRDQGYDRQYKLTYQILLDELKTILDKEVGMMVVGNEGSSYSGLTHTLNTTNNVSTATFSVSGLNTKPIGDFGTDGKGKLMPLMNAKEFTVNFEGIKPEGTPKQIMDDLRNHFPFTENTLIINKEIELERGVARIDWKDLERSTVDNSNPNASLKDYIYQVNNSDFLVKIHSLQVFNVNTESYLFRHTAAGTSTGANRKPELFGVEKGKTEGYNWVAGSDWDFQGSPSEEGSFTKGGLFLNSLSDIKDNKSNNATGSSSTGYITISELTRKEGDKSVRPLQDDYYPWCYITENTLPSTDTDDLDDNATGIAFTFKIMNGDSPLGEYKTGDTLPNGITSDPEDGDNSRIRLTDNKGKWIQVSYTEVEGNPEASGYFITYYAFIIHNDNDKTPGGPMEYAIVRNNVYEVMVKSLSSLPDPNEPETMYISLDINILAWVRHDIEITF